jgi:hypothetical protein
MSKKMTVGELLKALKDREASDEVSVYLPGVDEAVEVTDFETDDGCVFLHLGKTGMDTGRSSALALLGDIGRMAEKAAGYLEGE